MLIDTNFVILLIWCLLEEIVGHGVMQSPPARNYMWRLGFKTETNYDDIGLNCGGFSNQWDTNGGRCGTCGDPYQGPRDHEAGGRYAKYDRPISQCYTTDGKIDVKIRITAYHKGYFEFRLCDHNDLYTPVTQNCLNRRLLTVAGTNNSRYDIGYFNQEFYTFQLDIPEDVTCHQCVIQWLYNTGNSYGCDADGCDVGRGPQEQFINCADIAILPNCSHFHIQSSITASSQSDESHSFDTHNNWDDDTDSSWDDDTDRNWDDYTGSNWDDDTDENWDHDTVSNWDHSHQTQNQYSNHIQSTNGITNDRTTIWQPTGLVTQRTPHRSRDYSCYAIGLFAAVPRMHEWCEFNCNAENSFCPETHCRCGDGDDYYKSERPCFAVGFWAELAGYSDWCHKNCNHNPSYCPSGICQCY